jgi:GNAT superfamily N-acetyltransferase
MFKATQLFLLATLTLVFHSFFSSAFAEEGIRFKVALGSEIASYTQDLVRISDAVYSQYPYLYDGVQSDEEFYLRLYARWPDARLVMAFDQNQAIGYAIGVPMKDIPIGQEPLLVNGYAVNSLFLLGEIAILEPYRRRQIGKKMVQQIERFAKDEIGCKAICLSQIDEACVLTPKT